MPGQAAPHRRRAPLPAILAAWVLALALVVVVLASTGGDLPTAGKALLVVGTALVVAAATWEALRSSRRSWDDTAGARPGTASQRDAELRALATATMASATDEFETALGLLADELVPDLADWCVIQVTDRDGTLQRLAARHAGCAVGHLDGASGDQRCDRDLSDVVPRAAELAQRVNGTGATEVWPALGSPAAPSCLVVALRAGTAALGTMTLAMDQPRAGFDPADVGIAEDLARIVAAAIDRVQLHRRTREAVRRSQRIARQLHQLIAASITVAGLRSEPEVLVRLAGIVRSVFDADAAVVSLEAGPASPLQIVAERDREIVVGPAGSHAAEAPVRLGSDLVPVREGAWLVAPMLVRRGEARGSVAIRRHPDSAFSEDDVEVLSLLSQMASSSLDASEMNRAIVSSEERWRVLVETAPVGIVETDLDGKVLWWNRAAGSLFAWPAVDDPGLTGAPSFPDDATAGLAALWSEVLAGQIVAARDLPGVEVGATKLDLTASAAVLAPSSDGATSILTLVDDVTEHLQLMEELRHAQRMEVIGQLSSSVAHDFNNLLTLISGYTELLSQEVGADDRARQLTQDIQATTTRASTLTGKLLTIGRTKTPQPVVFSPAAAIGSISEVLDRVIGSSIELALDLDPAAGNIRADADQFEQTILNLSINARDAMTSGGVLRISLTAAALDDAAAGRHGLASGDYVRIEVTDTGDGMDEETRRRCFEPLFTTKGPNSGTGLGLPAARRVVTESAGIIECRSEPGRGTSFEILLPVVDEPVQHESVASLAAPPQEACTVLLAEDEEGIRRIVKRVLEHNGFRVLEADSGERAMQVAASGEDPFDLLISDIVMPGMSGRELAGSLQAAHPGLLVVLMSGNVDASAMEDLIPGSAAFLGKPFRPSELLDVVRDLRATAARATGNRRG